MAHKFERLKKEPAYLKVYHAVEKDILSGDIGEGDALPTEIELCEQFGVTRSTVREGLRLLEQSDLVIRGAGKRFFAKRPDASDVALTTSKSLALGGVTFREVWETLLTMYPNAVRLAVKRFSKEQLAELASIHDQLEKTSDSDAEAIVVLAVEFFQQLANGLNNRVLLAMLQSLNMLIGASLAQVLNGAPKARRRILEAQSNIIRAIKARDEDEASRWLAKHIDDLKRGYAVAHVDLDAKIT